jgi:hypothetical protein
MGNKDAAYPASGLFNLGRDGANWYWSCVDDEGDTFHMTYAASLNTWTHLAVAATGDVYAYLYVNGVQRDSQSLYEDPFAANSNRFYIGARDKSGSVESFWQGQIHDARIYNRALSAVEIMDMYACRGKDKQLTSLVARWPMNDSTGTLTSVKDVGPSQFTSTLVDSPTWAYPGVLRIA